MQAERPIQSGADATERDARVYGTSGSGQSKATPEAVATDKPLHPLKERGADQEKPRSVPDMIYPAVKTPEDVETTLQYLFTEPRLSHAQRFGSVAALLRRAVILSDVYPAAESFQHKFYAFTEQLMSAIRSYTDAFSRNSGTGDFTAFRTAIFLAAADDSYAFTSVACSYEETRMPEQKLLREDAVTEEKAVSFLPVGQYIVQGVKKLVLWTETQTRTGTREKMSSTLPVAALAEWATREAERWLSDPAPVQQAAENYQVSSRTSWKDYLEYAGKTLTGNLFSGAGVFAEIEKTVGQKVEAAFALKGKFLADGSSAGGAELVSVIDEIYADLDRYTAAFGAGMRIFVQQQIDSIRYNVAFTKGLLWGLYDGFTGEIELLVKAAVIAVCGVVLYILTGLDFIAGALYQIVIDLRDICYAIWYVFSHLEEIGQQISQFFSGVQSGLDLFLSLPFTEIFKSLGGAVGQTDFAPYFGQFGSFIGSMISGGTLRFLFEDARPFDPFGKSIWENLKIIANYYFRWGAFIGPLIIEVIVAFYTGGAGTMEIIGKNGARYLARASGWIYKFITDLVATLAKAYKQLDGLITFARKVAEIIRDNVAEVMKLVKKGVDFIPDQLKTIFHWLYDMVEPYELLEFFLGLLAAAYGPPPAEAPANTE